MGELFENKPDRWNYPSSLLRAAFDEKNSGKLREAVNYIQMMVQQNEATTFQSSPMTESELRELMETGKGTIFVGSGTAGSRIYIENGEISMPINSDKDREVGLSCQLNFRRIFVLPFDDAEARIKF